MFGCLRFLRREISLMAVLGTPSSSFSSLIFLIATISSVSVFFALQTTPQVPSPSFSSLWYLSRFLIGWVSAFSYWAVCQLPCILPSSFVGLFNISYFFFSFSCLTCIFLLAFLFLSLFSVTLYEMFCRFGIWLFVCGGSPQFLKQNYF